ncbi:MAG: hypothetical protein LC792_09140, partial [Actinobacteria bacterium]|nr:hypothetical protein [Actinomycetota bacterium]
MSLRALFCALFQNLARTPGSAAGRSVVLGEPVVVAPPSADRRARGLGAAGFFALPPAAVVVLRACGRGGVEADRVDGELRPVADPWPAEPAEAGGFVAWARPERDDAAGRAGVATRFDPPDAGAGFAFAAGREALARPVSSAAMTSPLSRSRHSLGGH